MWTNRQLWITTPGASGNSNRTSGSDSEVDNNFSIRRTR